MIDENSNYPLKDWRMQVYEGNTQLGYEAWVAAQIENESAGHADCPFAYWTPEASKMIAEEGWILTSDNEDRVVIQRLDYPADVGEDFPDEPLFSSDDDALNHVCYRALLGYRVHLLAIYLLGQPVNRPLNMLPPAQFRLPKRKRH